MGTVSLIGAGGVVQEFDLPLAAVFAEQMEKGYLRAATSDDEAAMAPDDDEAQPVKKAVKKAAPKATEG